MELPKRKSIRLKDYDYSQNGVYFVTICVQKKECLLGTIVGAVIGRPIVQLNEYGEITKTAVEQILLHYEKVVLDKYVIMPNHIHLILSISNTNDGRPLTAPTLSWIVNQLKGTISKKIGFSIFQKSFHDHIIRDEKEYQKIWEYIDTNP